MAKRSIHQVARRLGLAGPATLAVLCGIVPGSAHAVDGDRSSDGCSPAVTDVAAGPQTLAFDGHERTYLLALPVGYDGTTAAPLVFNFHGGGGDQASAEEHTRMGRAGTARGYIVVTPSALGDPAGWNLFGDPSRPDDYGFVDALAAQLSAQLCVDTARVFAAGISNGSAFTGLLACKEPYRFAAVAMVAAFVPPEYANCPDGVTPSVVAFHGTEDPGIPYEGGLVEGVTLEGEFPVPGVRDTLSAYAERYGCEQPVEEDEPAPDVLRHRFDQCAQGSRAVLYTIVGGGHEWPGATGGQFSATDAILDFFDEQGDTPVGTTGEIG